ncbi:hypothetical protein [Parasphingorhabdus sp.]|uniref:hypothetical protein n=1 Tax=Parasphingorhabdus sp. TaxID=2709688 RepID=UPI0030AB1126|nr:hypothetical protein [Sphingomonadales bacterium]
MMSKQQSDQTLRRLIMMGGLLLAIFAPPVLAQDKGLARPQLFNDLVECRLIADSAARLACYDQKVAQLDSAQKNNELVVADRAEVQEAERGVFGLKLPRIKLFSGNDDDQQITEITQTVASAKQLGRGKWFLILDDGATWVQTDTTMLSSYPKKGSSILIKRAAIGSFLAKVDGGRAFRIKRIVE